MAATREALTSTSPRRPAKGLKALRAGEQRFDGAEAGLVAAAARELVRQLEAIASPIKAFVDERCIVQPGAFITVDALFDEWREWTHAQGRHDAGTVQLFGRNLSAAFPQLKTTQPRIHAERVRGYEGIRLRNVGDPD